MCSLCNKPPAQEEWPRVELGLRNDLIRLAAEDTPEQANGLHLLLTTVQPWVKVEGLKGVKKYRRGRHRFYIAGRHTDCQYSIAFILLNKKAEDDKPMEKQYQNRILRALEGGDGPALVAVNDGAPVLDVGAVPDAANVDVGAHAP